jgi:hypothetical protein
MVERIRVVVASAKRLGWISRTNVSQVNKCYWGDYVSHSSRSERKSEGKDIRLVHA